ncbi:restriction endonuclease [Ectothiorhodospiraceae bacterium 2226]|nr:restriction endonuclease [Ectothiorhodospiraceae bacterium 2226]
MTRTTWMVRASTGGRLADEFVEKGVVGIGWRSLGDFGHYPDKAAILRALKELRPDGRPGNQQNGASQVYRFREEPQAGDRVLTYDSGRRIYHVGEITGPYRHEPALIPTLPNVRPVRWLGNIDRDVLSTATRNSLGSTLTLFRVPDFAADEIAKRLSGETQVTLQPRPEEETEAEEADDEETLLEGYRKEAFEIIKDRVNRLDADQMEKLVAGLLRSMGYKTRQSDPGPDRGIDLLASPDGFGFESPRIVAEVKHRNGAIGAQQVRSFLGGRHADDKGLYVSTGGFTKDARYEADRAKIPLMLMDLDGLVTALMEHYENADSETRALLPLRRIYWPI